MDCLDACLHKVQEKGPLVFVFDAEGPVRFFVIATSSDTVIIWEDCSDEETYCTRISGVNDVQLVLEFVSDIELYMDDWYKEWDHSFTLEELKDKLNELKALLPKWWRLRKIIK